MRRFVFVCDILRHWSYNLPLLFALYVDHQPQRSDDGRGAEHSYHRNDEEEIEANGGRENYQNGVTPPDYSNGDVENHDVVDVQNGCLPHTVCHTLLGSRQQCLAPAEFFFVVPCKVYTT